MVNGLHLYSAFIQSALQFLPLIHPFTHTFTHQRRLAAMQGTNQLVRSNWGLGVLLMDTSTRPGWDRTGNPPTARRQLYLLSHIAPLGLLIPVNHHLNATAYLSFVADHVHPFMATMHPISSGCFQQDNAPGHKAEVVSNWFHEHDNELNVLQWPSQARSE